MRRRAASSPLHGSSRTHAVASSCAVVTLGPGRPAALCTVVVVSSCFSGAQRPVAFRAKSRGLQAGQQMCVPCSRHPRHPGESVSKVCLVLFSRRGVLLTWWSPHLERPPAHCVVRESCTSWARAQLSPQPGVDLLRLCLCGRLGRRTHRITLAVSTPMVHEARKAI